MTHGSWRAEDIWIAAIRYLTFTYSAGILGGLSMVGRLLRFEVTALVTYDYRRLRSRRSTMF